MIATIFRTIGQAMNGKHRQKLIALVALVLSGAALIYFKNDLSKSVQSDKTKRSAKAFKTKVNSSTQTSINYITQAGAQKSTASSSSSSAANQAAQTASQAKKAAAEQLSAYNQSYNQQVSAAQSSYKSAMQSLYDYAYGKIKAYLTKTKGQGDLPLTWRSGQGLTNPRDILAANSYTHNVQESLKALTSGDFVDYPYDSWKMPTTPVYTAPTYSPPTV